MAIIRINPVFAALLFLISMAAPVHADTDSNPCTGILAIVDRPSVGDSACVVPYGKALLEIGYQYQKLHPQGQEQDFPQAVFRLGLPANNEFVIVLPNFIHESTTPHSGLTATTLGIKHEIGYTQDWIYTAEALFTLPSGSANFGSNGLGVAVNGIVSYSFNSKLSLTVMFGVTSETDTSYNGGQRFTSANPDIVLAWSPTEKINLFGEVYGQTKTGPGQTSGINTDGGITYLLFENVTVDLEVGQRLKGNLGGFEHYIGTGMAILF